MSGARLRVINVVDAGVAVQPYANGSFCLVKFDFRSDLPILCSIKNCWTALADLFSAVIFSGNIEVTKAPFFP
jgi:hypothetical protein